MVLDPSLLTLVATGGLAAVGIAFNLFLLRVLRRMGDRWGTFPSRLATCVACGDIVAALSLVSFAGLRYGFIYSYSLGYLYCSTSSFGLLFCLNMSALAVATIALDRHRAVSHRPRLRPRCTSRVLGGVALAYAAVLVFNAFRGAFTVDMVLGFCLPGGHPALWVVDFFETLLVGSSILILCACIIGIFVRQRASKELPEAKLPPHAVVWLVAYLLCYVPKVAMAVLSGPADKAYTFDTGCTLVLGFGGALVTNPLLIMLLHPRVYQEARATLSPRVVGSIVEL